MPSSTQKLMTCFVFLMSSIQTTMSAGVIHQRYSSSSRTDFLIEVFVYHKNGTFTRTHSANLDLYPETPRAIQFPIISNEKTFEYEFTMINAVTGKKINTTSHRSYILEKKKKNEWISETVIINEVKLTIETKYERNIDQFEETMEKTNYFEVDPVKCGFVLMFTFIVFVTALMICNNIRKQNDTFPRLSRDELSIDNKKMDSKIYTIEHGINNGFVAGQEEFYERYTAAPNDVGSFNINRINQIENYTIAKNGPMQASTCHLLSQPSTLV